MATKIDTRQRLNDIIEEVGLLYPERGPLARATILAMVAKQHLFVVSEPGCAKSQLAREICARITGARTFEVQLSKSRPDQAVLGPFNLPALRDEGRFERNTEGYLPTADLAILDEASKASPVLGHDLLSILNERVYHEVSNGRSAHPVPLPTAVCTGNEIPTESGPDAAALWEGPRP